MMGQNNKFLIKVRLRHTVRWMEWTEGLNFANDYAPVSSALVRTCLYH